jgi:sugar lactone lactonase YvrE
VRRLIALAAAVAALATPAAAGVGGTIVTVAEVGHPRGLAVLRDGSFLVAEPYANRVQRVARDGTLTTVAGTGAAGLSGDGGPATAAELDFVHGVAPMPDGGFVLADTLNDRVRRVLPDGTIETLAHGVSAPRGVATFPDGRVLVPDTGGNRVRLVETDGTIRTVAGTGVAGFSGDGGPAVAAELSHPFGVGPLPDGGFLVADTGNARVRRVWPDGRITTVAGDGIDGYAGDGGPAVDAELSAVHNVAAVPGGGFLFADTGNNRVRLVRADGTIVTIAGTGTAGFAGDGGPATAAQLDQPKAVALTAAGGVLVADALNDRVRLVDAHLLPRLTLRLARRALRARPGGLVSVRFVLSAPATVRARLPRTSKAVEARAGAGSLTLRAPLRPRRYRLELVATASGGRIARATGILAVSR